MSDFMVRLNHDIISEMAALLSLIKLDEYLINAADLNNFRCEKSKKICVPNNILLLGIISSYHPKFEHSLSA